MPLIRIVGGELRDLYLSLCHREFNGDERAGARAYGIFEAVDRLMGGEAAGHLVMEFDCFQVGIALSIANFIALGHGLDPHDEDEAWDIAVRCSESNDPLMREAIL